jgi:hypothetical protein
MAKQLHKRSGGQGGADLPLPLIRLVVISGMA